MYKTLLKHHIPVARHIIVNRDPAEGAVNEIIEEEDYIEVVGKGRISKPFVEKPVDAEDHNVYIYYPKSSGGGSKRLFRKVKDRSSEYFKDVNAVRRDSSYIYEEFLTTEGTDVKVYAVTQTYAHAEARKSPVLDGRVMRNEAGVEVRFPISLSPFEKSLARVITIGFGQRVCGFDMLRSNGKTYVCDVNGWSFVKQNEGYCEDAAILLTQCMRNAVYGPYLAKSERTSSLPLEPRSPIHPQGKKHTTIDTIFKHEPEGQHMELRAVIGVFRHGDRTPKQKLKVVVKHPLLMAFATQHMRARDGSLKAEVKLKSAKALGELLEITKTIIREILAEMEAEHEAHHHERLDELVQIRTVLEINGNFNGINRKVQFKPVTQGLDAHTQQYSLTEALLVLKWGGTLTKEGKKHAEQIGQSFRQRMYPGKSGLQRLHSTYRHDLKIYSSDEGRVQVTAAAFTKGLLDLEGHLTPILASMVRKNKDVDFLLDDSSKATSKMKEMKAKLREILHASPKVGLDKAVPGGAQSVVKVCLKGGYFVVLWIHICSFNIFFMCIYLDSSISICVLVLYPFKI